MNYESASHGNWQYSPLDLVGCGRRDYLLIYFFHICYRNLAMHF